MSLIYHHINEQEQKLINAAKKALLKENVDSARIDRDMKERDRRLREAHADYARRGIDPSKWEELDKIADDDYRRAAMDDAGAHHDARK